MTTDLFITLLVAFATVSGLVTEGLKNAFEGNGKKISANVLAMIDALVVGGLGTVAAYIFMNIPFTLNNILAIVGMVISVGLGSMVGYDKVIQMVKQIAGTKVE